MSRAVGRCTAAAGAVLGATAGAAALAGVAVVLLVERSSGRVTSALLLFVLTVHWLHQSGRRRHTQAAPYAIIAGAMTLIGLCGYFLYPFIVERGPVPHLFAFDRGEASAQQALLVYAVAAVVPAGFARFGPARRYRRDGAGPVAPETASTREHPSRWLVAVAVMTPLVWLAGCDIPALFERTSYQGFYGSSVQLYRIGNGLNLGATVLALFLLSSRPTAGQRVLLLASLVVTTFLAIGTTSRQAALLPLIALAVWLVRSRPRRLAALVGIALTVALSLVLLQAMLTLRNGGPHGFLPYLDRLAADPAFHLVPDPPRHLANLLSGFAKAGYLLASERTDEAYLWAQLDPRPQLGGASGTRAGDGFILSYIPFNTLGTLAGVGVLAVTAFSVVTCAVFWVSTSIVGAARHPFYRQSAIALLCGAAMLVAIFYSQYPVRSTVRVLTYLPLLSLSVVLAERLSARMAVRHVGPAVTASRVVPHGLAPGRR